MSTSAAAIVSTSSASTALRRRLLLDSTRSFSSLSHFSPSSALSTQCRVRVDASAAPLSSSSAGKKSLASYTSILSSFSSSPRCFSTLPYIDGGNYYPRLRCAYRIDMVSPNYTSLPHVSPFPEDVATAARLTCSLHHLPLNAAEKSILLELIAAHNPTWYVPDHSLIILISKSLPTHGDNRNRCIQQLEALITESRRLCALILQRRAAGATAPLSVREVFGLPSTEAAAGDGTVVDASAETTRALEEWRAGYERTVEKPEWVDFADYKPPIKKVPVVSQVTKRRRFRVEHKVTPE